MIRPAGPDDAEAIAGIHRRAWLHAYSEFLDPAAIDAQPMEERVRVWTDRLGDSKGIRTWVWDQDGTVVGFASAGQADEEDGGETIGSLWALYVDPPAQGAGVGRALLDQVEGEMRATGFAEMVLWVFEPNEASRRFYEKRGWQFEEGSAARHTPWDAAGVRYRRSL